MAPKPKLNSTDYDVSFCYFEPLLQHGRPIECDKDDIATEYQCEHLLDSNEDPTFNDPYKNNPEYELVSTKIENVNCRVNGYLIAYGTNHHFYYKRVASPTPPPSTKTYCFKEQKQTNKNRSDYGETKWVRDPSCDGNCGGSPDPYSPPEPTPSEKATLITMGASYQNNYPSYGNEFELDFRIDGTLSRTVTLFADINYKDLDTGITDYKNGSIVIRKGSYKNENIEFRITSPDSGSERENLQIISTKFTLNSSADNELFTNTFPIID